MKFDGQIYSKIFFFNTRNLPNAMIYRAIGIMSGSSLDGLDIAFIEFHESKGIWEYEIKAADCYPYSGEWVKKLRGAIQCNALDYQLLHTEYGHYIGEQVNRFIELFKVYTDKGRQRDKATHTLDKITLTISLLVFRPMSSAFDLFS